jgi:hypothetical protein
MNPACVALVRATHAKCSLRKGALHVGAGHRTTVTEVEALDALIEKRANVGVIAGDVGLVVVLAGVGGKQQSTEGAAGHDVAHERSVIVQDHHHRAGGMAGHRHHVAADAPGPEIEPRRHQGVGREAREDLGDERLQERRAEARGVERIVLATERLIRVALTEHHDGAGPPPELRCEAGVIAVRVRDDDHRQLPKAEPFRGEPSFELGQVADGPGVDEHGPRRVHHVRIGEPQRNLDDARVLGGLAHQGDLGRASGEREEGSGEGGPSRQHGPRIHGVRRVVASVPSGSRPRDCTRERFASSAFGGTMRLFP